MQVAAGVHPAPRKYHAHTHTLITAAQGADNVGGAGSGDRGGGGAVMVGVVAGGTTTTPGLTCATDTWAWTLDCDVKTLTWHQLPDMPAAVYDTRAVAGGDAVYVFGGHLCSAGKPETPDYPFYYINQVRLHVV